MNPKDLPEIPALTTITREVARISDELAQELGMIQCLTCERYYTPEHMAQPGSCFRKGVDVYRMWPTCRVCAEDQEREQFREQGHGW